MAELPWNHKLIDLSVTVSDTLPATWPGHMPFSAKVWNYYSDLQEEQGFVKSEAPYQTRFWIIDEHCGTHFDAPTHFVPPPASGLPFAGELGRQTGEHVPLQELMGDGVCMDVSDLCTESVAPGESPWITVEHVRNWEAEHGDLQAGEIVLFKTGWDKYYTTGRDATLYSVAPLIHQSAPGWPAPHADTVIYLYEKGIRTLGIDAPSIGAAHEGAPAHQEGLSRGMRYIEMLTALDKLPHRNFWFIFLPVKVQGATGGPGRAVAFVD